MERVPDDQSADSFYLLRHLGLHCAPSAETQRRRESVWIRERWGEKVMGIGKDLEDGGESGVSTLMMGVQKKRWISGREDGGMHINSKQY